MTSVAFCSMLKAGTFFLFFLCKLLNLFLSYMIAHAMMTRVMFAAVGLGRESFAY